MGHNLLVKYIVSNHKIYHGWLAIKASAELVTSLFVGLGFTVCLVSLFKWLIYDQNLNFAF